MIFDENDIKFDELSDDEFEELCYDLLLRLGFHSLVWRKGGADSGRDIEGFFTVTNPLLKTYNERWFFECKRYKQGVPVEELASKFHWADAEKPKHLVIFTTSYLSNSARHWAEKVTADKPYTVHVIEGKQLKTILLGFPDLIEDYFIDRYLKLLSDAKRNWIVLDVLPSSEAIYLLLQNIDLEKLSNNYLVFLWCVIKYKEEDLQAWCEDKKVEFDIIKLLAYLIQRCEEVVPVYKHVANLNTRGVNIIHHKIIERPSRGYANEHVIVTMFEEVNLRLIPCIYCLHKMNFYEGVEAFVEANTELSYKLRYINRTYAQPLNH